MSIDLPNDPFGNAVSDYYKKRWRVLPIKVESNLNSEEKISPSYLFRKFKKMPEIEQEALTRCKGRVLDIGACAGSHALYLQNNNIRVKAIDISNACCEIMKLRGLKEVECVDFYDMITGKDFYDTLLLLMNGLGISGTISGLKKLLTRAKLLLNEKGRILFDSSDIQYVYTEPDGSIRFPLNKEYYGELRYTLSYKGIKGDPFNWLFIDPEKMNEVAKECGYIFHLLKEGKHFNYLGELIPISNV